MLFMINGCASYRITTPDGWTADIKTTRKLESAEIYVGKDGSAGVRLNGVTYPDVGRFIPWPVPVPQRYENELPPGNKSLDATIRSPAQVEL